MSSDSHQRPFANHQLRLQPVQPCSAATSGCSIQALGIRLLHNCALGPSPPLPFPTCPSPALRSLCCACHPLAGYIGEFEFVDNHRSGKIVVELNGRLNKCGAISPRYDIAAKDIEAWVGRLLPSRQVSRAAAGGVRLPGGLAEGCTRAHACAPPLRPLHACCPPTGRNCFCLSSASLHMLILALPPTLAPACSSATSS